MNQARHYLPTDKQILEWAREKLGMNSRVHKDGSMQGWDIRSTTGFWDTLDSFEIGNIPGLDPPDPRIKMVSRGSSKN